MWTRLFSCSVALALVSCSIREAEPPAAPVANSAVELRLNVSPEPEIKKYKVTISWPAQDWPGDRTLQRSVRFIDNKPDWKDIFSETADRPVGAFEEVLEEPGQVGYRLVDTNGYKTPISLAINSVMIPFDLVVEGERRLDMKDFTFGRIVFRDKSVAVVTPYRIADNRYAVPSITANYIYSDGEAEIRTPTPAEYMHTMKTDFLAPLVRPMVVLKTISLRGKLKLVANYIPPLEKEEFDARKKKLDPDDFNLVPGLNASILSPDSDKPIFEFRNAPKREKGVDFTHSVSYLLHAGSPKLWVGEIEVPATSVGVYQDSADLKKLYVVSPTGMVVVLNEEGMPQKFTHIALFKELEFKDDSIRLAKAPESDQRYVPDIKAKRITSLEELPKNVSRITGFFDRIDELNKKYQFWELYFHFDQFIYPYDPDALAQCFDSLAELEKDYLQILYTRRVAAVSVYSGNIEGEKSGRAAFDAYNHHAVLYTDPGKGCERALKDLKQTLLAH